MGWAYFSGIDYRKIHWIGRCSDVDFASGYTTHFWYSYYMVLETNTFVCFATADMV